MDFIEKLFGISPDGGNGMLEVSILVSVAIAGVLATWWAIQRVRKLRR